jgi:hypothetical protein
MVAMQRGCHSTNCGEGCHHRAISLLGIAFGRGRFTLSEMRILLGPTSGLSVRSRRPDCPDAFLSGVRAGKEYVSSVEEAHEVDEASKNRGKARHHAQSGQPGLFE